MTKKFLKSGFTLIEVLLVVSIIGLLASVVLVSANITRAKARDASKEVAANQVKTALSLYNTGNSSNKQMPGNYLTNNSSTYTYPNDTGTNMAFEDLSNPENPTTASGQAYNRSMQDLVDAKVLAAIPHSPGGQPYGYYNYGPGTTAGAVFYASLESVTPSSTGVSGSCRPISGGTNSNDFFPMPGQFGDINLNMYSNQECPGGVYSPSCFLVWHEIHYNDDTYCMYKLYDDGHTVPTCPAYSPTASAVVSAPCDTNISSDYCVCSPY